MSDLPTTSDEAIEQLRAKFEEPTFEEKIEYIYQTLKSVEPLVDQLPALLAQVEPVIIGLKNSPVLKMIGVKLP